MEIEMRNFLFAMALLVSPAIAADPYQPDVELRGLTPYDWSGAYVGAYVGAGAIVNELSLGGLTANGVGGEGIMGGGFVGYNYSLSGFILGLQAEIGIGDLETTAAAPGFALTAKQTWDYSISARAGVPIDRALLYLIAGYTHAEYETTITGAPKFRQGYNGWHLGTGVDVAVTDSIFVGMEYRYTQFGGENWNLPGLDVAPSSHTGKIRVGYKF